MSCKDCETIQEMNLEVKGVAYLRIDTSNVVVGACDYHFNTLRKVLGMLPKDAPMDTPVARLNREQFGGVE